MDEYKSELESKILEHDHNYWVENDPTISDEEYDNLFKELKSIEPENKVINTVSSDNIIDSGKVKHSVPMLSLDKIFTFDELKNWTKKIARNINENFIISPKFDGISARYYASANVLATRGDGTFGENITSKLPLLKFESENLNNNKNINGEIIIDFDTFQNTELTRSNGKKYTTPRSLVAGIMNLKDISDVLGKINLIFMDHKFITYKMNYKEITEENWNNIIIEIDKLKLKYPIDGIVIELEDTHYSQSLGVTAHHPRGKVAFKFENNHAYSKIEDIIFQSGKRKLTPVAQITPVNVNNVVIKYVTMHNAKMLIDNDVHIGDVVKVMRSGDVIPYIAGVYPGEERRKVYLSECPYCNGDLKYEEPELYCTNPDCSGTTSKQLYESVRTLGIDGVGQTSVEKFIDFLGIKNIVDFMNLSIDSIKELDDFGVTSATNIVNSISKVKSGVEDYKLLACLNIQGVGKTVSKSILKKYTLDDLISGKLETEDLISNIEGIGVKRAEQIYSEIEKHKLILKDLMSLVNIIETKKQNDLLPATTIDGNNPTICFTGTFPNKKDYYKQKAILAGFEVVESVTKKLNYLVTAGPSTNKLNQAIKNGIRILSIEEFEKLIN